jgi:hypothetical protein
MKKVLILKQDPRYLHSNYVVEFKKVLNVDFTNQNKLEHILTNKSQYGALLITSQNVLKAITQLNIKIGKKKLTWILLGLKSKHLWSESKHANFVKI